ncbi:MAG: hypothetical protein IJE78_05040 [Bacteroidaceae bacterium]|nr:hypothetical protein [Bacteroidaceae bacterium]
MVLAFEERFESPSIIKLKHTPVTNIQLFIDDPDNHTCVCGAGLSLEDFKSDGELIHMSRYVDLNNRFSVRVCYEYEFQDPLDNKEHIDIDKGKEGNTMKITDDRKPLKKYSEIECGSVFSFMAGKLIYAIKTDLDAGQDAPVAVDLATGKHRLLSPHTTVSVVDDAELILK